MALTRLNTLENAQNALIELCAAVKMFKGKSDKGFAKSKVAYVEGITYKWEE